MEYETALWLAQQLRDNWKYWSDLERGAVIVRFRECGESHRALAKIAGCKRLSQRSDLSIISIEKTDWLSQALHDTNTALVFEMSPRRIDAVVSLSQLTAAGEPIAVLSILAGLLLLQPG